VGGVLTAQQQGGVYSILACLLLLQTTVMVPAVHGEAMQLLHE
jgi:hypothetical protein